MSMDKAILHGKEHRKPYRGAKAFDRTCRNHGTCPWCEENRKHKFRDKHLPEKQDEDVEIYDAQKTDCQMEVQASNEGRIDNENSIF